MGRDCCFIGSEVPLQVGNQDFALDQLFFHSWLNCLLAVELKVGRFEPEYLGKLSFFLEAVDRDVREPHERPTLGLLLGPSLGMIAFFSRKKLRAPLTPLNAECRYTLPVLGPLRN